MYRLVASQAVLNETLKSADEDGTCNRTFWSETLGAFAQTASEALPSMVGAVDA
jgi:hypothetical protein